MVAVEEPSAVVGVDAAATGLTTAASDTAAVTEKAEVVVDAAAEAGAAEQLPRRGGGDGTGALAGTTRQDSMVVPCGAATTAVVPVGVVGKTGSGEGVEGRLATGRWERFTPVRTPTVFVVPAAAALAVDVTAHVECMAVAVVAAGHAATAGIADATPRRPG